MDLTFRRRENDVRDGDARFAPRRKQISPASQSYSKAIGLSFAGRAAFIKAIGVVIAFGALAGPSALAENVDTLQSATRVAAVGGGPESLARRPSGPVRGTEFNADLKLLLAQNGTPLLTADGTPSDDTILVAFASSTPLSFDEDVAKQHGLELIDRTELLSFGLRIVRYRARDNTPIAAIIANLQKDQRISTAQANAEYRLPAPSGPPNEVSRLNPPGARQAKRPDPPSASVRRHSGGKTVTVAAPKPAEQPRIVDVAGTPRAGGLDKGQRPLASAGQTALRFPTADEPFVNVGVGGR